MTEKRFEVVMNEFDEVEYIMDKVMMEDRDFAEFIDFVEDVCKENEQLKKILQFLQNDNAESILNVLNTQQNEIMRLIGENEHLKQKLELYGEIYPTGRWITELKSEELKKELEE